MDIPFRDDVRFSNPVGHNLSLVVGMGLKFIYSEKATKFYEIFTLLLTAVHTVKSKVEIWQNFVAFSEYTKWVG